MRPIDILSATVVLCTVVILLLMARMPDRAAAPMSQTGGTGAATFRYPAEPDETNNATSGRWQLPTQEEATNDADRVLQIHLPDQTASPPADAPRFYYPLSKRTYSL